MDNGFNCPHAKRYEDRTAPFRDIDYFHWPVIVKPADSAGSKGVNWVDEPEKLPGAIEAAQWLTGRKPGLYFIEEVFY